MVPTSWEPLAAARLHRVVVDHADAYWRATILARSETQALLQNVQEFGDLLFQAAAETDRSGVLAADLWIEFRRLGLAVAPFPREFGGVGLCQPAFHPELCTVLRVLGSADLSVARLFEGHVNAISLVHRYGSRRQMQKLAKCIANGGLSAVWGADDETGLRITGDCPRLLQGRKILASGAGLVTDPIVTAKAASGQMMCLLHLSKDEAVDLSAWNPLGMRSTATGAIELSGIVLATDNIVGKAGDFVRQPYLSGGAWRFCAAQLGATERLVDLFRDHLVARGRGEDPYQLQRLAQSVACARTARFWVEEAARRLSLDEVESSNVVAFANLTRMTTERCALDVMEIVQRGVGLGSFIRPHPIERLSRDLATYLRQPVPDLAMSDGGKGFLNSTLSVADF